MQNEAKLLEESLLIIWNDRDAAARLKAMQEIYAADIAFYEIRIYRKNRCCYSLSNVL